MKYLNALLKGEEIAQHPREEVPLKPRKPVSAVSAGPPPKSAREFEPWTQGERAFLSRPLGQENNPDPWDAWAPFLSWLREHHPDRFQSVCEAEEAIRALERRGVIAGQEYERACVELLQVFEEARRLRMRESVLVWVWEKESDKKQAFPSPLESPSASLNEAIKFIHAKLAAGPQRTALLIREWAGERDGSTGRWIADLNAARRLLGVEAFSADDNRTWWRLPQETMQ